MTKIKMIMPNVCIINVDFTIEFKPSFSSGPTTSTSLIDSLMPTLRNYDENGVLRTTTDQNERLTSFDSFMQSLDEEYDKRKQAKSKPIEKKPAEIKKLARPPSPLTLDGPIEYRDQKLKKNAKTKTKSKPKPKPVIISSSSEDENGDNDQRQMVYDEDEAW